MFRLFEEDVRASDADREHTVEVLKRHYADGRLTSAELSSRVAAAYDAVGLSRLDALVRDLPFLPAPPVRGHAGGIGRRAGTVLAVSLALLATLMVVDAIPAEIWATLLFLGLPLLMMLVFGLLPLALPVLVIAWLFRSLGAGPSQRPPRQLGMPPGRVGGTWYFRDLGSRRHP